ncbi:MAG: ribonuclease HI family protein [Conexivisphaera sp.]
MDAQIYTDGASRGNPGPCAYAYLIVRGGDVVARRSGYIGTCTNNEAEYVAVREALEEALRLGLRRVRIHSDSRLVINQLSGRWRARNPRMRALAAGIRALAAKFDEVEFVNVPREDPLIGAVDAMCNETLDALRGAGAR